MEEDTTLAHPCCPYARLLASSFLLAWDPFFARWLWAYKSPGMTLKLLEPVSQGLSGAEKRLGAGR